MDLDELRGVQSTERQRDSLQHLRDSFYEDVAAYIAGRKQRRDERAASVDNPFSDDEVRKLSDEIETAEEVVESLYERRIGKVVKLSSFAAADAPVDTEGMTTEEADLFDDLVGRIERNKETVLDVLGGTDVDVDAPGAAGPSTGASADPSDGTPEPTSPTPGGDEGATANAGGDILADAMGGEGPDGESGPTSPSPVDASDDDPPVPPEEPDPSGDGPEQVLGGNSSEDGDRVESGSTESGGEPTGAESNPDDDRTTVRITRDVGQILGVDDREYDLESEDVVTLPSANAGPLVDRDAAERLE